MPTRSRSQEKSNQRRFDYHLGDVTLDEFRSRYREQADAFGHRRLTEQEVRERWRMLHPSDRLRRPEAMSSGGQHPAGAATAEDRQADDEADDYSYTYTYTDVDDDTDEDMPAALPRRDRGRDDDTDDDTDEDMPADPADGGGQAASKRRRTEDHEGSASEDTSVARCRALVVDQRQGSLAGCSWDAVSRLQEHTGATIIAVLGMDGTDSWKQRFRAWRAITTLARAGGCMLLVNPLRWSFGSGLADKAVLDPKVIYVKLHSVDVHDAATSCVQIVVVNNRGGRPCKTLPTIGDAIESDSPWLLVGNMGGGDGTARFYLGHTVVKRECGTLKDDKNKVYAIGNCKDLKGFLYSDDVDRGARLAEWDSQPPASSDLPLFSRAETFLHRLAAAKEATLSQEVADLMFATFGEKEHHVEVDGLPLTAASFSFALPASFGTLSFHAPRRTRPRFIQRRSTPCWHCQKSS